MLTIITLLSFLAAPALGVSVSYKAGSGMESVSSSESFSLSSSASLREETVIGHGEMFQRRTAGGSGDNSISQRLSGDGSSVNSDIRSSGSLNVLTISSAGGGQAGLSQRLSGNGDVTSAVGGSSGKDSSSQQAGVSDGGLSSEQSSLAAEGIAAAVQRTSISGEAGGVASISSSDENTMVLDGRFSGENAMSADLLSASKDRAVVGGHASIAGIHCLDGIAGMKGDEGMMVEGLYTAPRDMGEFSMGIFNAEESPTGSGVSYQTPSYTSDGGNKKAYVLTGCRWNKKNPQVKMYLRPDSYLTKEGLDKTNVQKALTAAGNTWDDATSQNLFSDAGVGITTSKKADTKDGYNVQAFKPITNSNAVAYSRYWYKYDKVGGYYSLVESDISYSTAYKWTTDAKKATGGRLDVRSVALHEMGHSIGLGDLYNKAQFSKDTRQVMHYYTGVKRTLGNGDKAGVYKLYG